MRGGLNWFLMTILCCLEAPAAAALREPFTIRVLAQRLPCENHVASELPSRPIRVLCSAPLNGFNALPGNAWTESDGFQCRVNREAQTVECERIMYLRQR